MLTDIRENEWRGYTRENIQRYFQLQQNSFTGFSNLISTDNKAIIQGSAAGMNAAGFLRTRFEHVVTLLRKQQSTYMVWRIGL